ncbi:MAG: pantoate--beta-alanine ligase [Bdellovibrionales bacterium]|nr:pantoate--beta-alanine ligase [Bdellovibrionales bacterium]
MDVFHSVAEYRAWRARQAGPVGFVPTMGALHSGHAHLMAVCRREINTRAREGLGPRGSSVVSIFVNPTQFGPGEDFDRYPRTLEADLEICRAQGVDAVFAPSAREMYGDSYPEGFTTFVEETRLSKPLCGAVRPGHFRGVTTVVSLLFQATRPDRAFFGLKDAQQFFVLHRMARDLHLEVSVEGVATVREPDGLALSSRNRYLSAAEREIAPLIAQTLGALAAQLEKPLLDDTHSLGAILSEARAGLEARGLKVQYLEPRRLPDFELWSAADQAADRPGVLAVAAHLGQTRLIDNRLIHGKHLKSLGYILHI